MKITILGGAGVRTPSIIQAFSRRQDNIGVDELCLMDINQERLGLIGCITEELEKSGKIHFRVSRTVDAQEALDNADFVITTFRVGDIESRIIDEKIALENGILGQETTGAGGFSMALRTIPVLGNYITMMKKLCPEAWLINFANPSGILTEFIHQKSDWQRAVGICDGPESMRHFAGHLLDVDYHEIYLDYFGLNHLGWVRKVFYQGNDLLPSILKNIKGSPIYKELPFDDAIYQSLGMIPNEYNYYYYYAKKAVNNIRKAEQSRGEQIKELNDLLFKDLKVIRGNYGELTRRYSKYQLDRWETYMKAETGKFTEINDAQFDQINVDEQNEEGYSGVALDLIEGLIGKKPQVIILNIQNEGAIDGIDPNAVVEIPAYVGKDLIRPMNVGKIPAHCLGLMNQVKNYEQLTIEAAVKSSYKDAVSALTFHPLIADHELAKRLVDCYGMAHGDYYPKLIKDK